MKDLQFKTDIKCGGCVSKITPVLDTAEGVCEWNVNIADKDKILTVKTDSLSSADIISKLEKAGFKASVL